MRVSAFLTALVVAVILLTSTFLASTPGHAVTIAPDLAFAGIGPAAPGVQAPDAEPSGPPSFTLRWLPAVATPRIAPPGLAAPRSFLANFIGYRSANAEERLLPQPARREGQMQFSHVALGVAMLAVPDNTARLSPADRYGRAPLYLNAEPAPAQEHPAPLPLALVLALILVPVGLVLLQALRGGQHLSYRPLRRLDRR